MSSGGTVGAQSPEPPPGWAGATPHGAPWPHDLAQAAPTALRRPVPMFPSGEEAAGTQQSAARRDRQPHAGRADPGQQHHQVALLTRPQRPRQGRRDADPPPPARAVARRGLVWAGIAAATLIALAAALVLTGTARPVGPGGRAAAAHVLSLPRTIGGYSRGAYGSSETLTSGDSFVSAPRTAVYQLDGAAGQTAGQTGGLLAGSIGIDVGHLSAVSPDTALSRIYADFKAQIGKISAIQILQGQAPADELAEAQTIVGPPRPAEAGPLGGRVSCWQMTGPGAASFGPAAAASCLWADADTFGFLFAPGWSTSRLAATLLMFRSAIEIHSR